jgi:hypothetical protein
MLEMVGGFLAKLNSLVNIFIYMVLDREFRQLFVKMIRCR